MLSSRRRLSQNWLKSTTVASTGSGVLIDHNFIQYATGSSTTATTPALNTTGATLLVIAAGYDPASSNHAVSDSKNNTWTGLTAKDASAGVRTRLYYVNSATPTVGSGHTFTISGSASYAAICAAAFSNTLTSPADVEGLGLGGNDSSAETSSVTPSTDNYLVLAAIGLGGSGGTSQSTTANGGFTIVDAVACDAEYGVSLAYLKQTTAAAAAPVFTVTGTAGQQWSTVIDSFKGT